MNIVIAGGHGQIALLLTRMLAERGDTVTGLIRDPGQAGDVRAAGGRPEVCDLEHATETEVTGLLGGAQAAVFAAGAGPGSGAARKDTVDRAASVLLAGAAEKAGVRRFVQVSALGAGRPDPPATPGSDGVWAAYITAKKRAEQDLRARDLDWLILRPGRLTGRAATGRVTMAEGAVPRGEVTRTDVAAVIAALLPAAELRRRTLELVNGDVPIAEAIARLT